MLFVIERISDAMVRKTPFPYFHSRSSFFHESMGVAALDELHGALQREGRFGSEKEMDVVGHNDKFVELKDSTVPISEKGFDKQCCSPFGPEDRPSFPSH